ncbi:hypothetical protein CRG98_049886 [Punica granatum]|uniref:Uncharacterized protein n=1 Tax=Punica granatum TaxID=22663 RepID=A0A2I0H1N5_PUNGR|nr:hypothetical protein CRG98_049886 [Punica granatum]
MGRWAAGLGRAGPTLTGLSYRTELGRTGLYWTAEGQRVEERSRLARTVRAASSRWRDVSGLSVDCRKRSFVARARRKLV